MKKYKALMLDLDGTTVPNDRDGIPSQRVTEAIKKASKKIQISVVTGRPQFYIQHILKQLELTGLIISNGGAVIIDATTGKIRKEWIIPRDEIEAIFRLLEEEKMTILLNGRDLGEESVPYHESLSLDHIRSFSIFDLQPASADTLQTKLQQFPTIAVHKVVGWEKGTNWLQITHAEATKQYAIFEVAKMLDIETHEIIGVGDGYNDFPLLMACGLKIAMGNAVPELKAIADYIAPTVEDDGVAHIIEKFILDGND